jgi:pyrroloquinoline quinone biosynthesis protein E
MGYVEREVIGVGSVVQTSWGIKDGVRFPIPLEVSIEVTHNCPFHCLMCSSSSKFSWNSGTLENELPPIALFNTINEISKLDAKAISWSGGEALLLKELIELLKYSHMKGLKNWIYTNGVVWGKERNTITVASPELLGEIAKYSDRVMLNIQGDKPEIVDYIMGRKGAFDIIEKFAEMLKSNGVKWVEGHFVPMKPNFKRLEATVNYWLGRDKVDRLSFLRFVPQGRGERNRRLLELNAYELLEINKKLERLQKEYGRERIRIGRPLNFGFLINRKEKPYSCRAGLDAPLIQPTGRVDACPAWKMLPENYALGWLNPNGKGLIDIWINSPIVKLLRVINTASPEELMGMLKGDCLSCRFFVDCKGRCVAQRIRKWGSIYDTPDPLCPLIELRSLKSVAVGCRG